MEKRIITAAITGGIHTPSMSPYLPVTPRQIADEAVRACSAGAAVAHIHVRDSDTGRPIPSLDLFREVITEVKAQCDVVICLTTGGAPGMTVEQRGAVISAFKPEMASLNFGSLNFAIFPMLSKYKEFRFSWEEEYLARTDDNIFPNTFRTLKEFSGLFAENKTRPEIEIYDLGMLNNLDFMIQEGYLSKPVYLQFVMGILGGVPPTMENLMFLHRTAHERLGDFVWSVCAAGRHQIKMCATSLLMGGNVRVGMEDSLYLEKNRLAKSNAEQVEKIVRIGREFGIEFATPDEARQILVLKGQD
ncbi:MAG: 3-keto-5-aminohexanoate cleavage protein, partial [Desulfobacterales bacterium]|nr:3-keto-5-aminohexanoate cleavage protein [Desulfobacterales bacterium]